LAEAEHLRVQQQAPQSTLSADALLYELQVHQIELEMQNQQLLQGQAELADSQKRYADLYEFAPVSYLTISQQGTISAVNISGAELLGESRQKLLGTVFSRYISPEDGDRWYLHFRHALKTGEIQRCELKIQHAGGAIAHVILESKNKGVDEKTTLLITLTDITARRQNEIDLTHANRAYAALSEVNRNMMQFINEYEFLQDVCAVLVDKCGYLMASVGYVEHDEQKSIKLMAHAGNGEDYLKKAHITWTADTAINERGMGPSGRAVRSGVSQICQDIAQDLQFAPWRDHAIKQGYLSSAAIPMLNGPTNTEVYGIINAYSAKSNAFTQSEIDLLEQLAADVSYGLRMLKVRKERDVAVEQTQQQLVQLQESLEGTVRAICEMVEIRDPYTAGHQSRVSPLATAIALRMGLADGQIKAIRFAGELHDLGKIQVPAEILSKPGKLNAVEFELIKGHVQAGYDVLKDINFPWPIAQIVLQHHERLDGSGYPQGIKGEAILLEARILSVADVVEAMASHRPYRAMLGVDVALNEITSKRGSQFDPQVVDACVALFHEKSFSF
jgi:PAS domain S-box-containing protein